MPDDHEDMVWRGDAVEVVRAVRRDALAGHATETVALDAVGDRVLAEDIDADRDVPDSDRATMDGYAFDAAEPYPLRIADSVYPEDEAPSIGPGEAVEIATGAPLPDRATAVLKREDATVADGLLDGPPLDPGTYTYRRGSNVRAGERLFAAGEQLSPKDAIFLGDLGREAVTVRERFSVGLLATGTEIHEGRIPDLDSDMLAGLIRSWGHEATYEGTAPDDYDRTRSRMAEVADEHDVVVTTGGTSVGHEDHVVRALADLGELRFHRVRVRPGKPIGFAMLDDAVAFAVPGKPIGAHTIATLVVRPFFTASRGLPTVEATVDCDLTLGPEGFEYAVPVTLSGADDERGEVGPSGDGRRVATPLGHVDSPLEVYEHEFDPSVLSSSTRASRADGFVLTRRPLEADETVDVVPYAVLE